MKALFSIVILLLRTQVSPGAIDQVISAGTNRPAGPPRPAAFPSPLTLLSQDQMVQGLREALNRGVQQAVLELGREGGFLTNLQVRIPMPQKLASVERTLRSLGQDRLADDFIAAMNHAAEQAVPQATAVFFDAVQRMSIADAEAILTGPEDAATQYFQRVTQTNLHRRFLPIVKSATAQAGVTGAYKRLLEVMNQNQYLGILSSVFLSPETVDIDAYVTERALDGLFKMVAREEVRIRRDPVARTSELLQKVFGAIYGGSR